MKQKTTDAATARILNFVVTTVSVKDEKGKEIDPREWEDFYKAIPAMDRAELSKRTKFDTGVDKIKCVCPHCGEEWEESVPINADFFRF